MLCAIPARPRGADASSRTLRREAMDAEAVTDEHGRSGRQNRVVPIPRRWDQPLGLKSPGGRWLERPARRGEHVYAVNQSRREGRVAPVEPVVIFLRIPRVQPASGLPCALSHWEGWIFHKARALCAARRKAMSLSSWTSEAKPSADPGPITTGGYFTKAGRTSLARQRPLVVMSPGFRQDDGGGCCRLHLHLALRQKSCTLVICRAASGV
jgi:hypothetical protein